MSRPLMWVGVAYTLGVIWAAGDQKLFYGTAGIVLFVWITGRIRQPWKEKRLFWLLPVWPFCQVPQSLSSAASPFRITSSGVITIFIILSCLSKGISFLN